MYTLRQYNVLRVDYMPLKKQYEMIGNYWKNKLVTRPALLKEDKRYITFIVRV